MILIFLLLCSFMLIFSKKKEKFDIVSDAKKAIEKVKNFEKDIRTLGDKIKDLPNTIKKEVVDPVIDPIKDFTNMLKNIRFEKI